MNRSHHFLRLHKRHISRYLVAIYILSSSMGLFATITDPALDQHFVKEIQKNNHRIVDQEAKAASCMASGSHVMNQVAWQELQVEWLGTKFPTITSFGSWVLKRSLYPIEDYDTITTRQALIRKLVQNEALYEDIRQALLTIRECESPVLGVFTSTNEFTGASEAYPLVGGLLAYGDENQDQDSRKLFLKVKPLYYSKTLTKPLNGSTLALEASTGIELGRMGLQFVAILGVDGAFNGMYKWFVSPTATGSQFFQYYRDGFIDGIKRPIRFLDPRRNVTNPGNPNPEPDILGSGTAGDMVHSIQRKFAPGGFVKTSAVNTAAYGLAGSRAFGQFYFMYQAAKSTGGYWIYLYQALNQLHSHMNSIARAMDAVTTLRELVQRDEYLQKSCIAQHLDEIFTQASPDFLEAIEELKSGTFTTESNIYSRGRLLKVHRLLKRAKGELMAVLQAIGELDTVYAFATAVKNNENTATPFCFVDFDQTSLKPVISFKECWIPVLDNAVSNTIEFGNNNPTKIIITGPNGGGKSTFLKALGQCVVLAQSWGIVPARQARMTLFGKLLTCLHPQESLQDGMSTFMAEKSRVDEITASLLQYRSSSAKVMLLLDEPFKGTVDDESAERIYKFGYDIAYNDKALVGIATHVHKPIKLAKDTKNAFSNKHVVITELSPGQFKREFKLADGPANWWFQDRGQRARFVDWLGDETMKVKKTAAAA